MTKARTLADFISDGNPLADGTIAVSEVSGAAPLASPSFTGNIAVTGNVDGRDVAADGTKLDGIETSATADQTDAEIRTAVEAATDSNVFTDADHSKLNAIEASATADQTDAEIRTAVEAATDSNVFTDADHTKLNAIEASADVTDTANVVAALTAGSNITIAANGTIAGAAQYTHPTHAGDDASVDTGALSGATVISDLDFNITTDTLGHVTDANATVATRNLTLANLGYTGATNANYITNNNQLTNGAGYITTSGVAVATSAPTGSDGQLYYNTSEDILYCFNATKGIWEVITIQAGLVPNTVSGSQSFTTAGTFTWTVPAGVSNFAVVGVGAGSKGGDYAGGGGGGALAYTNFVITEPSQVWNVVVGLSDTAAYPSNTGGGNTRMFSSVPNAFDILTAGGASPLGTDWNQTGYSGTQGLGAAGGVVVAGTGGGAGGRGGHTNTGSYYAPGGGGGAGGYSGAGGHGADNTAAGASGSGGGAGGGGKAYNVNGYSVGAGGGGVGVNGQGSSGAGGVSGESNNNQNFTIGGGAGGSGGASAPNMTYNLGNASGGGAAGAYGGGGGAVSNNAANKSNGANGALRIVWKSGNPTAYYFPSTNVT